jgi:xanthine dehydrogenase/oxidase
MSVLDTSTWSKSILFFLNGKKISVDDSKAVDTTLLSFLRSRGIGLTGSKLGCGEGGCGACTVMVSRYNVITKRVEYVPIGFRMETNCPSDSLPNFNSSLLDWSFDLAT